jgi:hypothetical protein
MHLVVRKHGRVLLTLVAIMSIAVSACSSNSKPAASAGSNNNGVAVATDNSANQGSGSGTGISGAADNFASISSYKFSMTLAGGTWGSMLSSLGGAGASGGGAMTISGTVVSKPAAASDVTMSGFHIIQIGGFDYLDMGTGSFIKSASSSSSMADAFSPSKMFSQYVGVSGASGYNKVGSETKNGVDTDHYQASASALTGYASLAGVANATWTVDVWIAKAGGYPVSLAMVAKAGDNSVAYEILFDITNVNDPANTITAPTNVTGA